MIREKYNILKFIRFNDLVNWNIKKISYDDFINTKFNMVPIRECIKRNKDKIRIEDNQRYKRVTIRTNNGGVVLRDNIYGKYINTKDQFQIKKGQLILSKIDARNGAIGIVSKELNEAVITGNFWVFDADLDKVDLEYLVLILTSKWFVEKWEVCSNGSGNRLYLQEELFLNTKIPLPKLEIQNQIIKDYKEMSNTIKNNEAKIKRLEDRIDEYLYKELGINVKNDNNILNKKYKILEFINFRDITQWGVNKILKNSHIESDKFSVISLNSKYYEILTRGKSPKYDENSDAIILNQKCNRLNYIDLSYAKNVNKNWLHSINKEDFTQEKDILINSTGEGTIGRASCIVDKENTNLMYDSHILLLRLNPKYINAEYYTYLFNSKIVQNQIEILKGAEATKQTELGIENVKKIMIPLPNIDVQNKIVNNINNICNEIQNLKTYSEKLNNEIDIYIKTKIFN